MVLGFVVIDVVQLCLGFVFGGVDEVEKVWLWFLYVIVGVLFEQGVEFEQCVVVWMCVELFDVFGGLFECVLQIVYGWFVLGFGLGCVWFDSMYFGGG